MIFKLVSPLASKLVVPMVPLKPCVLATWAVTWVRVGMFPPASSIARPMAAMMMFVESYAWALYAPTSWLYSVLYAASKVWAVGSVFGYGPATLKSLFAAFAPGSLAQLL